MRRFVIIQHKDDLVPIVAVWNGDNQYVWNTFKYNEEQLIRMRNNGYTILFLNHINEIA